MEFRGEMEFGFGFGDGFGEGGGNCCERHGVVSVLEGTIGVGGDLERKRSVVFGACKEKQREVEGREGGKMKEGDKG